MGRAGSASTGDDARLASEGSRMRSSAVWLGMTRARPFSKMAAVGAPLTSTCPSFISVFEVDGFVIAVEFQGGGALLFGPEAGVLGAAEGQLVFDSGARQVHCQQAGFGAVDVLEGARKIGGLDGGREPEGNRVGDAHGVFEVARAHDGQHWSEN